MKVVITGAGGQLGHDLNLTLQGITPPAGVTTALIDGQPVAHDEFEVKALDRQALDVTDEIMVSEVIGAMKPDVIVHCAAYTAVDRAEADPEGAERGNVLATRNVVRSAESAGAHLIYLSTDYVFAGDLGRPLTEDDSTDPRSVYGRTKLLGELECSPSASIIRTSWVAGLTGKTVIHLAARAARESMTLKFVDDQIGSLTSSADLAAGLSYFVRERPAGLFHVSGAGHASWYDVISFCVVEAGGSSDQVQPIPTSALEPQPAAVRPAFSALVSNQLPNSKEGALLEWQDGARRLVRTIVEEGSS